MRARLFTLPLCQRCVVAAMAKRSWRACSKRRGSATCALCWWERPVPRLRTLPSTRNAVFVSTMCAKTISAIFSRLLLNMAFSCAICWCCAVILLSSSPRCVILSGSEAWHLCDDFSGNCRYCELPFVANVEQHMALLNNERIEGGCSDALCVVDLWESDGIRRDDAGGAGEGISGP